MTSPPSPTPPALATTKRKFHRLLDNLTASASPTAITPPVYAPNVSTNAQPPISPEPVAKRPRSAEAASAERQRQVSAGQARIQALKDQLLTPRPSPGVARKATMRVVGTPAPETTTPRKPPNFQPYSQELFLARLKTFADVKKWTSKPDGIGEVEWARRGWSCDAWNIVACSGGCEKRVVVKLRPRRKATDGGEIDNSEDLTRPVEPALVARYAALIVDGHDNDCLWRKAGCPPDIYHIPIASRARSTADLLSRYSFLCAISTALPPAKNTTHPGPPTRTITSRLPPSFFPASLPAPSTEAEHTAFAFALFGWTGVVESRISLAVCNHCFQRLGLWLYASPRLEEMSVRLGVSVESLSLDLLQSHREHCPWKNGAVQGNPDDGPIAGMPAWQTLVFMLVGKHRHLISSTTSEKEKEKDKELPRLPPDDNPHSIDLSESETRPSLSLDLDARSAHGYNDEGDEETLTNKWKKFKAKLKRSTSKRSLKSVRSVKSTKSARSAKSGVEGDEE